MQLVKGNDQDLPSYEDILHIVINDEPPSYEDATGIYVDVNEVRRLLFESIPSICFEKFRKSCRNSWKITVFRNYVGCMCETSL